MSSDVAEMYGLSRGYSSAEAYTVAQTWPEPQRKHGLQVVVTGRGTRLELHPSRVSSYVLPGLEEFSATRGQAWLPAFSFTRGGQTAEFSDEERGGHGVDLGGLIRAAIAGLGAAGGQSFLTLRIAGRREVTPDRMYELALSSAVGPTTEKELSAGLGGLETESVTVSSGQVSTSPSVAEIASRVAAGSNLGDEMLASLLKVERETFCRWRTGVLTNPRTGNRQRLGLLMSLVDELEARGVQVKDWLLNVTTPEGLTPYQLLQRGRFNEVAYLASCIGAPATERDPHAAARLEREPLRFEDDDVWELGPPDEEQ